MIDTAGSPVPDEPPQLPPRRMKRPRSPWHDVPTNNSPIIDMDSDARQRMLSAAKYGRVIGTRNSHSMDLYDWSDSHPSDHSQHHAYEVVSDDTSPAGSNEHLAIYLSSESSDDEFHEEVVLRRNIQDQEFLYGIKTQENPFGNITNSSAMQPLTISTDMLPTLDSSGRVGLSHVEAMKLSLLMKAQKTSTESIKRQREEREKPVCYQESVQKDSALEVISTDTICASDVLQLPPEEFADKEDCKMNDRNEEVQGLLSPVGRLLHSCRDQPEGRVMEAKNETNNNELEDGSENPPIENCDERPRLPSKKVRGSWNVSSNEPCKRHSDELNDLLSQLASMTTAPLLPVGATCSLQMCALDSKKEMVDSVGCASGTVRKQVGCIVGSSMNNYY